MNDPGWSTRYPGLAIGALLVALAAGCTGGPEPVLTGLASPRVAARPVSGPGKTGGLFAGFGRADITPPPGVPMAGNGFEGMQAEGYRQRLYARALVLEDAEGSRLAIVVADLPHVSVVLHRRAAQAVFDSTKIGADRLLLSATHTHSGPGNHYGFNQYNGQSGPLPGFDEPLTEFLVEGIRQAVLQAFGELRPAKAAWGSAEIRGVTRNRSPEAYLRNPGARLPRIGEPVDDTLRMLRVDPCEPGWVNCRPQGAFSLFAIHGTVFSPANTFFDGDVHGVVERYVESAIEAQNPAPGSRPRDPEEVGHIDPSPPAFHLFANANEGDVSPAYTPESRCGPYRELIGGRRPSGPRTPEPAERRKVPPGDVVRCLDAGRSDAERLGATIGRAAVDLFAAIGASGRLSSDIAIGRAFRTVDLTAEADLCEPRTGVSTFGGADDARTRLFEWRPLGINVGLEEGGSAAWSRDHGCHGRKRIGLWPIQGWLVGKRGLPTHVQLGVYRIGDGLLASTPGEVTTMAGLAMRRAVASAYASASRRDVGEGAAGRSRPSVIGLVGLANGYIQYVTTAPEYAAQHYEGGSTLYGPHTARVLTDHLGELAGAVAAGVEVAEVDPIPIDPGASHSYVPTERGPAGREVDRVLSLTCDRDVLTTRWIDVYPGRLRPAAARVLEIRRLDEVGGATLVARDDALDLTVRAVGPRGSVGYAWEAVWAPRATLQGEFRVDLLRRPDVPSPRSGTVRCGS